jgi:putative transposase
VFHSDHGGQYTAIRFTQRLVDAGIAASMGSVGDSFDTQSSIVDEERRLVVWPVIRVACVETAGGGLRHDGRGCRLGA